MFEIAQVQMTDKLDRAVEAAVNVTVEVRTPYEAVLATLEGEYLALQRRFQNYNEPFRSAWKATRLATLEAAGWTEATFYAEMDRRRSLHFPGPKT